MVRRTPRKRVNPKGCVGSSPTFSATEGLLWVQHTALKAAGVPGPCEFESRPFLQTV